MNTAIRHMTVDRFLDWEPGDDHRYELVGGLIVRMQSEGVMHRRTKKNVLIAIDRRLPRNGPCEIFPEGGVVRIDDHTGYIPDAILDCTIPPGDNSKEHPEPMAIFEVAVTSEQRDLGEKRLAYFTHPAMQHYVVIVPARQRVYHWRRETAEGRELDASDMLTLEPPGITVPVAEFFERL